MKALSYFDVVTDDQLVNCGRRKLTLLRLVVATQRKLLGDIAEQSFMPDLCESVLKQILESTAGNYLELSALVGYVCSLPNPENAQVDPLEMNHIQVHGIRNTIQGLFLVPISMLPCEEAHSMERIIDVILNKILKQEGEQDYFGI